MALTEEQRQFRLRKLRTCFAGLDVDNDGYITTADFQEMGRRYAKEGNLSGTEKEDMEAAWMVIADELGLKEDHKTPLTKYLEGAMALCANPAGPDITRKAMMLAFEVIDTNHNGVISLKEFQVFFKCMGIKEEYAKASFDGIDTNHDGVITEDEFLAAAIEFFYGLDQSSGAVSFYGPLLD